jgi:hypothetical protein
MKLMLMQGEATRTKPQTIHLTEWSESIIKITHFESDHHMTVAAANEGIGVQHKAYNTIEDEWATT